MRLLVPLAARRSHRVMADSASTRDDLVHYVGTPADKRLANSRVNDSTARAETFPTVSCDAARVATAGVAASLVSSTRTG